jgi:hypothetical protein
MLFRALKNAFRQFLSDRHSKAFVPPDTSIPAAIQNQDTPSIGTIISSASMSLTLAMSGPHPSGVPMPVGNLPGWHQIFTEDFRTDVALGHFMHSVYKKKFHLYEDGTPDTAGQQGAPSRYYPSKVLSVRNGVLNEYLHTENGTPMVAALLPILPQRHRYGKYTIRFRADALKGFKTAWLLWPDSEEWPRDGEIDFPEGDLNKTIGGFVHHQNATSGSDQDAFRSHVTYTSWHTASTEWTPNKVKFILDDKIIGTSTHRVPDTPMHWVIQTEACLDGCPDPTTAGNLQIDWIVAYTHV